MTITITITTIITITTNYNKQLYKDTTTAQRDAILTIQFLDNSMIVPTLRMRRTNSSSFQGVSSCGNAESWTQERRTLFFINPKALPIVAAPTRGVEKRRVT